MNFPYDDVDKINKELHKLIEFNQKLDKLEKKSDEVFKVSPLYNNMKTTINSLERELNTLQKKCEQQNSIIESKNELTKSLFLEISNLSKELEKYEETNYKDLFFDAKSRFLELSIKYKNSLEDIKELKTKLKNDNYLLTQIKQDNPDFDDNECYALLYRHCKIILDSERLKTQKIMNFLSNNGLYDLINDPDFHKLINEKRINKNVRFAGRKPKFSETEILSIKKYRNNGMTLKEIAEKFDASVGLIHKIVSDKK